VCPTAFAGEVQVSEAISHCRHVDVVAAHVVVDLIGARSGRHEREHCEYGRDTPPLHARIIAVLLLRFAPRGVLSGAGLLRRRGF
jgi:hypothetical protein